MTGSKRSFLNEELSVCTFFFPRVPCFVGFSQGSAPAEQTCLKVPFSLPLSLSAFTYESPESIINCGRKKKKRKTKNVGLFRTF